MFVLEYGSHIYNSDPINAATSHVHKVDKDFSRGRAQGLISIIIKLKYQGRLIEIRVEKHVDHNS